jgi:hypothetical protein
MSRGARDLAGLPRRFKRATPVAGLRVVGPPLDQASDKRCAGKVSLLVPCAAADYALWLPRPCVFLDETHHIIDHLRGALPVALI